MRLFSLSLLLALAACSSDQELLVNVSDVGDLAEGAPVRIGGVPVGTVSSIELAGGAVPVFVHMSVDSDHSALLEGGACASLEGNAINLRTGDEARPIEGGAVEVCPASLVDSAREAIEALQGGLGNLDEALGGAEREAGERLGAGLREAAGGFVDGVTMGGETRDLGRELGEQTRELVEGLEEGAAQMAP